MNKRFLSAILVLILIFTSSTGAFALTPDESFYVTDKAGVLSQSVTEEVTEFNGYLEHYCSGAQIVVVFVDYFGSVYADEYAVSLFNKWQIASNGMLLCVSTKEKRGGLTVGEDIESAFPDSEKNRVLDRYFWPSFDKGKYDKAVTSLMAELSDWYSDYYGVRLKYGETMSEDPSSPAESSSFLSSLGIIGTVLGAIWAMISGNTFWFIIAVIFLIILINGRKRPRSAGSNNLPGTVYTTYTRPHYHHPGSHTTHTSSGSGFRPSSTHSSGHSSGSHFGGMGRGGGGRSGGGFGGRR